MRAWAVKSWNRQSATLHLPTASVICLCVLMLFITRAKTTKNEWFTQYLLLWIPSDAKKTNDFGHRSHTYNVWMSLLYIYTKWHLKTNDVQAFVCNYLHYIASLVAFAFTYMHGVYFRPYTLSESKRKTSEKVWKATVNSEMLKSGELRADGPFFFPKDSQKVAEPQL